jgi:class 3 adenylate cyclase/tetratricopeptide (TPR) repeat protein
MRCAKCGKDNREGRRFCAECGAALAVKCAQCGESNEPDEKFCGDCGAPLASGLDAAPPTPAPGNSAAGISVTTEPGSEPTGEIPDGERKTVTALFADIKGSMELMEDLDPEEARAIVDPALRLMIDAVHRYDGYIVQSTGDGIFALFGAPVAHEDHPQRALYAALRMQEEMRRYSAKLRGSGNLPVEARVGVNTGEVVVRSIATGEGHAEYTPVGHSTGLAARMQALAPTGSVAATEQVRKLCEGYFVFKDLGPTRVKGVAGQVNVFEVVGLGPLRTRLQVSAQRGLTKFVGRQAELEQMKHALELARAGHGQIVAAMGEPGVGKSRLVFEFKAIAQSGCLVLEAYSVSHGKASAYLPVIDLLRRYFEITPEDDERKRHEKVTGKVLALDRSLEDTLPYLFVLLDIQQRGDDLAQLDPQLKRRRTLEAIKRILVRESLNQPLIVIFEDLHWIDSETQALLNLLVDGIATAPIMLLVNYRPEYRHQWGNKTYYTQLRLDPLGKEGGQELLTALMGDDESTLPLKRLIIERTEGNPFFVEEMVQALFEQGVLAGNGAVKRAKPLNEIRVPPTVQAILASRIDRLGTAEKELLQTLAVLGREFSSGLIKRVAGKSDDELERMLSDLQLSEFIYEQPAMGDIEYRFKHALTLEVGYNSVLGERRRLLHEYTGQAIEILYADRLEDHVAELAHHYERSANARKAVEYLARAGQRSVQQSAYPEAVTYLTRALEMLNQLPDGTDRARQELDLQRALAWSLYVTDPRSAQRETVLVRARELCQRVGDTTKLMEVLLALAHLRTLRGEVRLARELAEGVLALAEKAEAPAMLAGAHSALSLALFAVGQCEAAREHVERAIELFGPGPFRNFSDAYYAQLAAGLRSSVLLILGYPSAALANKQESIAAARRRSDPFSLFAALYSATLNEVLLRDSRTAAKHAEEMLSIASEHGMRMDFQQEVLFFHGWAMSATARGNEGIAEMGRSISHSTLANPPMAATRLATLAEACGSNGLTEEGLEAIAQGMALDETQSKAELNRVKGELLLKRDPSDPAEAERCLRTAIDIARRQRARLLELRATTSLARLLQGQGKIDEARNILAEIYNWFTEGFDTADLKDAKTLLEELSA